MKTKHFLLVLVGFWAGSLAAGFAFNALLEKFGIASTHLSFWQVCQLVTVIDVWIIIAITLIILFITRKK